MKLSASLVASSDIEVTRSGMIARSASPWLALEFRGGTPSGRWIRIAYRASYLDHLVRPRIRFEKADGEEWDVLSAPLFGRTSWIGPVPADTRRILISPVDRAGPFGFEIEEVETVSRLSLLPRAFQHNRKTAFMAIGARIIHARQETRQALRFARGGVAMHDYQRWRAGRSRPFDPTGLDAPRRASDQQPHVRFLHVGRGQPLALETPVVASLLASGGDCWSIGVARLQDVDEAARSVLASRLVVSSAGEGWPVDDLSSADLVARLDPALQFSDYALPVLLEAASRDQGAECFYADEESRRADGALAPVLKPDWSPDFEAGLSYLGQPVFWRVDKIRRMGAFIVQEFESAAWRRRALAGATPAQVHHIRRVFATGPASAHVRVSPAVTPAARPPSVSIVIPTKNQLPLLQACLNGLRFETGDPILEILIVDNGSDASVQSYYATLANDPRIKIMQMPGRFNFSAMCNAAAAAAQGECLVFLNNDMSVVSQNWLGPLTALAMRPDIGAVGARLLFPGGSIQHAGVVVGMGGYADHVSHGAPGDSPGYLGRLRVVHEVGAVTGACIAIEARKFREVKGFDAERFPVELNDIDLCLRLARAGWRNLMSPQSVLIHHQSATRGFSFRPFDRYGLERGHFRDMWGDVIRDDPFFHPALSLFSPEPALDG